MTSSVWSTGFLTTADNVTLHYHQSLPSASLAFTALPVLVYLHGLAMSGKTLLVPSTKFSVDFEVILPDARGHGLSSPLPPKTLLMPYLVADVISVIEIFSRGLPVFLMGHSMGAATAARIAKIRPDLIRALVLEEPPWRRLPGTPANIPAEIPERIPADIPADFPAKFSAEIPADIPSLVRMARDLRNMTNDEFFEFDTAGRDLPEFAESEIRALRSWDVENSEETLLELDIDIMEAIGGIKVPLELQMGDNQAEFPPFYSSALRPHIANRILLTYSSANFYFFKNGSHFLHKDPTAAVWTREVLRYFKSFVYNQV